MVTYSILILPIIDQKAVIKIHITLKKHSGVKTTLGLLIGGEMWNMWEVFIRDKDVNQSNFKLEWNMFAAQWQLMVAQGATKLCLNKMLF